VTSYLDRVEEIAAGVVAKNAAEVDQAGMFPRASMDALREAGLLGLISSREVGGMGQGPRAAAAVVERLARECGSTAMVTCMHYAGAAVIEKYGSEAVRKQVAAGEHLATLAFSERGSRSHFWAPVSTATADGDQVRLDAEKSWVTSAHEATLYVWSSQPLAAEGASTIWLVPRDTAGLQPLGSFDGLGLRGNDSTPVKAEGVVVPRDAILGEDGGGLAVMLETVLPIFNVMTSATAIGLMEGATTAACTHAAGTRYQHLDSPLCELPTIRAYLARMRIATDQVRCLWLDTIDAMENGREDVMLRVLQCKAAAGESATTVLDTAMRVCGGAAFRRDVGVERRFRDGRAGTVMAPTTDQLYDFIGKAVCGMPVF
jgi:alkylation response protein AidB-like acyl-CoA dehydrogenase